MRAEISLPGMRVVIFSTDTNTLVPGTPAFERQQAYAKHFDAYDIIFRFSWNIEVIRKADIISAQDPFETGFIAYGFAMIFGKPLHVQVHTDIYTKGFVRGHALNHIRRMIASFVLRRARRIRVVSESVKESIEKHAAPKVSITVLPIFVDTKRFQNIPRIKHQQFKIALLAVSRLEKEKNIGLAISALKAARDAGHDVGLTIVGSGSEEEKLKALTHTLGLDRFVAFVGVGDPIPHYAYADAVLVPSLYEGYSMVTIESLAAGIPVIATDVGIAREAGAIVTSEKDFIKTVVRWIESGPRQSSLAGYPYTAFEQYVQLYCNDLKATRT